MMPASREARQVQRLSISTGPLMTRPARYDDVPSCTTPLSNGGVQFEEMTLPPASKDRAFLTASQPADFMKKASVNSVKLIRTIVPDIARTWQRRSPALTRVRVLDTTTTWRERMFSPSSPRISLAVAVVALPQPRRVQRRNGS